MMTGGMRFIYEGEIFMSFVHSIKYVSAVLDR